MKFSKVQSHGINKYDPVFQHAEIFINLRIEFLIVFNCKLIIV